MYIKGEETRVTKLIKEGQIETSKDKVKKKLYGI